MYLFSCISVRGSLAVWECGQHQLLLEKSHPVPYPQFFFMASTVKRKSTPVDKPAKKSKPEASNIEELDSESEIDELDDLESGPEDNFAEFNEHDVDNDDELDDENSDLEEGISHNSGSTSSNSSGNAREQRQEKKRLQKERKLQKTHGKEIEQIKLLWEKLREKHGVPKQERERLVHEIMQLVDGKWKDVVLRHDASRVVQTVFKYADKALKHDITVSLKGTYVLLAKSAYGKYLLIKMLHYGSPQVRKSIVDEMHGHYRRLMGHKEGAYVLNDLYTIYATAKQRKQILREFFGSEYALFREAGDGKTDLKEIIAANPEKKNYLLENLNKVITAAVNKGSIGFEIVHAMMLEYIRNVDPKSMARENFVDLIADDIVEMVHTKDGSQVASLTLAMSTAKERKRLLKSMRQFPTKLAKDEFGNIVMMAAFLTVDDTKLTHKAFHEIESDLFSVLTDKYARRPLLMLLVGPQNKKYFGVLQSRFEEIDQVKQEFSKKEDNARIEELLLFFLPAIVNEVVSNTSNLLKESLGTQFVLEMLLNKTVQEQTEEFTKLVDAVAALFSDDPKSKNHILSVNPFSGRTAKTLVHQLPAFQTKFVDIVKQYPQEYATGEGCFSVVALLEENKDTKEGKSLRKLLAKHKKEIESSEARGKDLLLELLA